MKQEYAVATLKERPDLKPEVSRLCRSAWPEFALNDASANLYWQPLIEEFPEYQFFLYEIETQHVIAAGQTVPFAWDGTLENLPRGWGDTLESGVTRRDGKPNTLSAIAASILPEEQGKGLSARLLLEMRKIAEKSNFKTLVAPVRPSQKHQYPLMPIEDYAKWMRSDGLPNDSWLRVHRRLGAEFMKVEHDSMNITDSISEWEGWTGLKFPYSGEYVVPLALNPVRMDIEADRGVYIEPNVWMKHSL